MLGNPKIWGFFERELVMLTNTQKWLRNTPRKLKNNLQVVNPQQDSMVVEEQIFASRLFWVNQLNEPKKRILKPPLASPRDSKTTLSNMKIQESASLLVYLELEEGVKMVGS